MNSIRTKNVIMCCCIILSLIICVSGLDHAFCHIDLGLLDAVHISEHSCVNHRCNASEDEHSLHARHYGCCDNEEPHNHPEQNSSTNNSFLDTINSIIASAFYSDYILSVVGLAELEHESFTQRSEETYELLLCKDTVVLTI